MFFGINTDLLVEISFFEPDGSIYLVILGLKIPGVFVVVCWMVGLIEIQPVGGGKCLYMDLLNNLCSQPCPWD
jgi:hypothetical protein